MNKDLFTSRLAIDFNVITFRLKYLVWGQQYCKKHARKYFWCICYIFCWLWNLTATPCLWEMKIAKSQHKTGILHSVNTNTHIHTHAQADTLAHTQTHVQTNTHARTHRFTQTHTHTRMQWQDTFLGYVVVSHMKPDFWSLIQHPCSKIFFLFCFFGLTFSLCSVLLI